MRSDNTDTKALFIFNIFLSGRQSIKSLCSLWPYGPMGFNHISNIKPLHDDPKYAKAPPEHQHGCFKDIERAFAELYWLMLCLTLKLEHLSALEQCNEPIAPLLERRSNVLSESGGYWTLSLWSNASLMRPPGKQRNHWHLITRLCLIMFTSSTLWLSFSKFRVSGLRAGFQQRLRLRTNYRQAV